MGGKHKKVRRKPEERARDVPKDGPVVTPIDPMRREELRLKLRARLRHQDTSHATSAAQQLMTDPTSALLSMGVDDPNILRSAPGMIKSIATRVRAGKLVAGEQRVHETLASSSVYGGPNAAESSETAVLADDQSSGDDEEAPPSVAA